jgi:sucrose phosphorylase
MSPLDQFIFRIEGHLSVIYAKGNHSGLVDRLVDAMRLREHFFDAVPYASHWTEQDVTLIAYGDTILLKEGAPLAELKEFVTTRLGDAISIVHVLPYFP